VKIVKQLHPETAMIAKRIQLGVFPASLYLGNTQNHEAVFWQQHVGDVKRTNFNVNGTFYARTPIYF
jgi:hypothetical protein